MTETVTELCAGWKGQCAPYVGALASIYAFKGDLLKTRHKAYVRTSLAVSLGRQSYNPPSGQSPQNVRRSPNSREEWSPNDPPRGTTQN